MRKWPEQQSAREGRAFVQASISADVSADVWLAAKIL
jgi:hypothetical protein